MRTLGYNGLITTEKISKTKLTTHLHVNEEVTRISLVPGIDLDPILSSAMERFQHKG